MKKLYLISLGIVFILAMSSCLTAAPVNVTTKDINNPTVTIAPLSSQNYTILGSVSGIGKITHHSVTGSYTGDTLKYGTLGDLGQIGHVYNITNGWGQVIGTNIRTPGNSRDMAIGNANYEMIEKAKAMKADAIIFITTSVDAEADPKAKTTTTIATVTGIAIKLNY